MQIALQDIRLLGYRKIAKTFLCENQKEVLFDDIKALNNLYYSMKIPAYSLLNKWSLLDCYKSNEKLRGFSLFVYSLEPMIDLESPNDSAKRRCRNTWESTWNNFGMVANLEGYETTLLKDFGLKVLFIYVNYLSRWDDLHKLCSGIRIEDDSLYESLLRVLEFYNTVLTWATFTQQEGNFTKNNLSYIDVLNMLIVDSKSEFIDNLSSIH